MDTRSRQGQRGCRADRGRLHLDQFAADHFRRASIRRRQAERSGQGARFRGTGLLHGDQIRGCGATGEHDVKSRVAASECSPGRKPGVGYGF